ncbi:MAG: EAL domain-containing response regulator [Usitatibacter sp.]
MNVAAVPLPIARPIQFAELRFLVVEDRQLEREDIARMLRGLGAKEVAVADDADAALAILSRVGCPVDVVVSALDMPGMDGMQFIRHLGLAKFPVSVVLASRLERSLLNAVARMTEAYGVELVGIVEKPVTAQKLDAAISAPRVAKGRHAWRALKLEAKVEARPTFSLEEILAGLSKGEFEPFFQPRVQMAGGKIVSARALARWRHPEMGKIEPYAFISPLVDSGEIDQLTWVMLKMSAARCSEWRAQGLEETVSVKLALRSLEHPGLADRVTELVAGQGLDPHHMVLETTGHAADILAGAALENLARLRLRGFGLSVEECDTGPAAEQQLARIAFTEIRIGRTQAKDESIDASNRAAFMAMIETARTLGLTSTAQGVETQSDWDLCAGLGCDLAAGLFVAAPMEASAYATWVGSRSHWTSGR